MIKQRTVKQAVSTTGVGLHGGVKVNLTIRPAEINTGIIFRRTDVAEPILIPAKAHLIGDTRMCSCLEKNGVKVGTIEHLMSALCGLGIDNAWIDIDAPEVPILDGSAAPFIFLIQSAGIEEQNAPKKFIKIKQTIEVTDGDKWAKFEPYSEGYKLAFSIIFNHPAIDSSSQQAVVDFSYDSYVQEVSRARTFGFMQEVEFLRENGLALGGGLDNAIVLDEFRVLNPEGLRYSDEFVRHKILDAVGDLYLIGNPLLAAYSSHKGGHALNNMLARKLLKPENQHCWEFVTFEETATAPKGLLHWFGEKQWNLATA